MSIANTIANTIVNTEKIINFYNPKMDDTPRSLFDITVDGIVSDILIKKKSIKELKILPKSLEVAVMERLAPIDKYHWQEKILESAVTIAFEKSKDIMGDWQKFYDEDGYRDFHEVIYIKHHEHIDEEDYIEVNQFDTEFYYTYQKVFHKMFPDPEFEDLNLERDDYM
jgi:hypothetical protein